MKARHIIKAMAIVTIVSAITRVIAFVFKIYLSRMLGAEMLGVYQITMSIFLLFACVSSSGIPTALSRHVAALGIEGDDTSARGIVTTALLVSGGISLLIMSICYIFPNVTRLLFADRRCNEMFLIMLPALVSTSLYGVIRGYFWGKKEYAIYSLSECASEILSVLIVVLSVLLGIFKENMSRCVAYAVLISDYISAALLIILFYARGGRFARPRMFKPLIHSSTPITCTRLLGALVSSMMALLIPALLIKYGMSKGDATASYGRASGMVMSLIFAPSTIVGSLAVVMIPELAGMREGDSKLSLISPALTFSVVIASIFLSLYIAVGDRLCLWLYKDSIAGQYMAYAAIVMIPMSINQICVSMLNTMGHESATFKTHVTCSVVLSLCVLILPKYMGIYAYFVSLIVFHTLSSIVYIVLLNRYTRLAHNDLKYSLYTIILALILGMVLKCTKMYVYSDFLTIVIASIIILIVFAVYLPLMGIVHVNILKTRLKKRG